MVDVSDLRVNFYIAVNLTDVIGGCDCLRNSLLGITLRKHRLTLKIGSLNKITIDNSKFTDSRASQTFGMGRPQRATTNDKCARLKKTALAFFANSTEQYLPAVAFVHFKSQITIKITFS
jgi:hypothetical protein